MVSQAMKTKILKQKDLADYRAKLYAEQSGMCPLCNKYIPYEKAALDHCHKTGPIRAVLHGNCNSQEGRVKNHAARSGIQYELFVENLLMYWGLVHNEHPIHPKHLSKEQKEQKRIKKLMSKLKTDKAKPKYLKQIKDLQEIHNAKFE
jgi:hypothetical protein